MKTIDWTFVDKSGWGRGPWDDEPDKRQWRDPTTGLACLIHRSPSSGSLCGYVGVPGGLNWFGQDYSHDSINVDVHGGLTFSDFCGPTTEDGQGICHLPELGESDRVWWLGFDCGHYDDFMPMMSAYKRAPSREGLRLPACMMGVYRAMPYVEDQVRALARQVAEAA